jgi:hypothetical protein
MSQPDDFQTEFSVLLDRAIAQHWVIAQHQPYDRKHFEQVFGETYQRRWAELLGPKPVVHEELDETAFRRAVRGLSQPTELERLEAANALSASQQAELDAQRAREAAGAQAEIDVLTWRTDIVRGAWGFGPLKETPGEAAKRGDTDASEPSPGAGAPMPSWGPRAVSSPPSEIERPDAQPPFAMLGANLSALREECG